MATDAFEILSEVKANYPGTCYHCGRPIYTGQSIVIAKTLQDVQVAWHKNCDNPEAK